jgi:hypothetical protein
MKPIMHADFVEHEKKYLSDLDSKIKNLKKERTTTRSQHIHKLPKYDSKMINQIRERDMLDKIEQKRRIEDRLKMKQKMDMYAKLAMESHRPVVSQKKKIELEQIIQNLKHKPLVPRHSNSANNDRYKEKPWRQNAYMNIDENTYSI